MEASARNTLSLVAADAPALQALRLKARDAFLRGDDPDRIMASLGVAVEDFIHWKDSGNWGEALRALRAGDVGEMHRLVSMSGADLAARYNFMFSLLEEGLAYRCQTLATTRTDMRAAEFRVLAHALRETMMARRSLSTGTELPPASLPVPGLDGRESADEPAFEISA